MKKKFYDFTTTIRHKITSNKKKASHILFAKLY